MTALTVDDLLILVDLSERAPAVLSHLRMLLELDVLDRMPDRLGRIESILPSSSYHPPRCRACMRTIPQYPLAVHPDIAHAH